MYKMNISLKAQKDGRVLQDPGARVSVSLHPPQQVWSWYLLQLLLVP